jgi:peptidoglycan/LPS O-acetylase OafA/YrhL
LAATRIHALDGLRAIAASLVVTHHLIGSGSSLAATLIQSATESGVELFFVLSGVVLGPRYIREGRPLVVRDYFRRRVERLPFRQPAVLTLPVKGGRVNARPHLADIVAEVG